MGVTANEAGLRARTDRNLGHIGLGQPVENHGDEGDRHALLHRLADLQLL